MTPGSIARAGITAIRAAAQRPRVLCVDDEPQVLEGLALNLRRHYEVHVAGSGAEGLQRLEQDGPFAVVLSDMRMPGMTGAVFLAHVRQRAPDSVRLLLTGHAELDAAIAAINTGHIFRFLAKPCPDRSAAGRGRGGGGAVPADHRRAGAAGADPARAASRR